METYNEYKNLKRNQDAVVDMLSDKLNSFSKVNSGMVEESVRMSDDYRVIKNKFNKEFKKLQEINRVGMKMFKKEIRKEYEDKRSNLRQK